MSVTLVGVGPQKPNDARGWLTFDHLPAEIKRAEDATQAYDHDQMSGDWMGRAKRSRPATETERALLEHLGYTLPEKLTTEVEWITPSIRHRSWPELSGEADD